MDETIEIKVTSDLAGKRLDVILAEQCDDLTRSYINKLCKEERAKLNDKISKGNKKCKEGDKITLQIPEPEELEILPEKMDLDITDKRKYGRATIIFLKYRKTQIPRKG